MIKKKFPFKKPVLVTEHKNIGMDAIDEVDPGKEYYDKPIDLAAIGAQAKAEQAEKQAAYERSLMYNPSGAGTAAGTGAGMGTVGQYPELKPWPIIEVPMYREPKWLTLSEAAKHLKMGPTKFAKMRSEGPKYYKLSDGTILYNTHDVNDWVMSHAAS